MTISIASARGCACAANEFEGSQSLHGKEKKKVEGRKTKPRVGRSASTTCALDLLLILERVQQVSECFDVRIRIVVEVAVVFVLECVACGVDGDVRGELRLLGGGGGTDG